MKKNVAHFDLDTFFVSVARPQNNALEGKPIVIGGSSELGVVASCSYEARKFGVQLAMHIPANLQTNSRKLFLKDSGLPISYAYTSMILI